MTPKLTEEQQRAVEAHQGCVAVEGAEGEYVLMRVEVYREMLGIGPEADYQASLEAIRQGWADVQQGRTRPMEDFFAEFDQKHGISG